MQLHWSPTSPYARKVLVVAHELGIANRIETIHVVTRDEPRALLALNPCGKIPVLVTREGAIPDSILICEYLAVHSGTSGAASSVSPECWRARARAVQADAMLDAAMLVRAERLRPEAERSAQWEQTQLRKINRSLDMFETEAGEAGEEFGIAEISLACALSYFRLRFEADKFFSRRPKLARWLERVSKRLSMTETAPPSE